MQLLDWLQLAMDTERIMPSLTKNWKMKDMVKFLQPFSFKNFLHWHIFRVHNIVTSFLLCDQYFAPTLTNLKIYPI